MKKTCCCSSSSSSKTAQTIIEVAFSSQSAVWFVWFVVSTSRCWTRRRRDISCAKEGRKFGSLQKQQRICHRRALHFKWKYQPGLLTHNCQQSRIIWAMAGSMFPGISRCRFLNPTAPTTCIGFKPFQGIWHVANSHSITPKLYISHLQTWSKPTALMLEKIFLQ